VISGSEATHASPASVRSPPLAGIRPYTARVARSRTVPQCQPCQAGPAAALNPIAMRKVGVASQTGAATAMINAQSGLPRPTSNSAAAAPRAPGRERLRAGWERRTVAPHAPSGGATVISNMRVAQLPISPRVNAQITLRGSEPWVNERTQSGAELLGCHRGARGCVSVATGRSQRLSLFFIHNKVLLFYRKILSLYSSLIRALPATSGVPFQ